MRNLLHIGLLSGTIIANASEPVDMAKRTELDATIQKEIKKSLQP